MKFLGLAAIVIVLWLLFRKSGSNSTTVPVSNPDLGSAGQIPLIPLQQFDTSVLAHPYIPSSSSGTSGGTGFDGLDNMMQAIYQLEGGKTGDINVRNNNPGDLKTPAANQFAPGLATGAASGYATFADQGDGWTALQNYVETNATQHPDWNFYDFFQHYLGQQQGGPAVTDQGNSNTYADYVASYMGIDPTQPVLNTIYGS